MYRTVGPAIEKRLLPASIVGAALASGLLLAYYPTILSGFRAMQVEPLDTRLINYILEHSYLWLTGDPLHGSFWSPPVFYPATNTAAYSETLLGVAPLYWLFRGLGLLPDTSYQLWLMALSTLNYFAALFFLRRGLSVGVVGAATGAWLVAFGSPRTQQLIHAQLIPVFYVLIALYCVRRILADRTNSGWFVAIFFAAVTLQLYTSVYVAWFFIFGVAIASLLALSSAAARSRLGSIWRQRRAALLACSVLCVLTVSPMLMQYLEAAATRGYRQFAEVSPMLIRPQSWLYMGPFNWVYGGLAKLAPFAGLPMEHEHRLGVGLLTACAAVGLCAGRRNPIVLYTVVPVALISAAAMVFPGGGTAWSLVFDLVPGAGAMRAVSRIGMLALIPLGIGLALLVDRLASGHRRMLAALVVAAVFMEQGARLPSYDKAELRQVVARLAVRIPADCDAFLLVGGSGHLFWRGQVDAMWAGIEARKATLNGYSGNVPPGWPFFEDAVGDPQRLESAMSTWAVANRVEADTIALVDPR